MINIFEDEKLWQTYKAELESWLQTPYRHLCGVKGRGADCTLFIAHAMKNIGLIKKITYDYYPRDWHIHHNDEFVLESLYQHTFKENMMEGTTVVKFDVGEPIMRGDLLHFSTTKRNVSNHCSVVLDEFDGRCQMTIHSIENRGVSRFPLGRTWMRKQRGGFRFVEV